MAVIGQRRNPSRTSDERARSKTIKIGIVGTVAAVLAVSFALSGSALSAIFPGTSYNANFTEAGGLVGGDDVIVSGVVVGKVSSVDLDGNHVRVEFELTKTVHGLGDSTKAAVVSQTALGKKALLVIPKGSGKLEKGDTIPISRTVPSFDVTEALSNLTQNVASIDTDQLSNSLDQVSAVLRQAAPDLKPALEGVARLSGTLSSRDSELSQLLRSSAGVSEILADRDQQVQGLFVNGASLLAALNEQSKALDALFENATAMAQQVDGLVEDNNEQIQPALKQINQMLAMLQRNRDNINHALDSAGPLVRELGEVVAAFPGFNVYIPNLVMTNLVPVVPNMLMGAQTK